MAATRALYLVRHAIAEDRGPRWPDDNERPLTAEGAARMRRAVKGLDRITEPIALILSSPLVRAMQTADILSRGLGTRPDVLVCPALAPGGSPAKVVAALARYARPRAIALVGHEPDLGKLAAWLIGARTPIPFRKGGICRIDTTDWPATRESQLVWAATPKMLRRLAPGRS
jgi:phosphohistidine phosphatase